MDRREYIAAVSVLGSSVVSGCVSSTDSDDGVNEESTDSDDGESEEPNTPSEGSEQSEEGRPDFELTEVWTFEAPNTFQGVPAVKDGVVYAANEDARLYAIDAVAGDELWSFRLDRDRGYTPALSEDAVFTVHDGEARYGLDRSDGSVIWEQERGFFAGNPVHTENGLFIPDGGIKAVDPTTGEVEWEYSAGSYASSPVVVGQNKVISVGGDEVYAVDQANGEEVWHIRLDGDTRSDSLQVDENYVTIPADNEQIHVLNIETGEIDLRISTEGTASVSLIEGSLYYLDNDGLHLYDIETESEQWSVVDSLLSGANLPSTYYSDEFLFASYRGLIHVDRDNGDFYQVNELQRSRNAQPFVVDDYLLLPDDSNTLHAFEHI